MTELCTTSNRISIKKSPRSGSCRKLNRETAFLLRCPHKFDFIYALMSQPYFAANLWPTGETRSTTSWARKLSHILSAPLAVESEKNIFMPKVEVTSGWGKKKSKRVLWPIKAAEIYFNIFERKKWKTVASCVKSHLNTNRKACGLMNALLYMIEKDQRQKLKTRKGDANDFYFKGTKLVSTSRRPMPGRGW